MKHSQSGYCEAERSMYFRSGPQREFHWLLSATDVERFDLGGLLFHIR